MGNSLICPVCGHRACDISDKPVNEVDLDIKCPHCKNFVRFQFSKNSIKKFPIKASSIKLKI